MGTARPFERAILIVLTGSTSCGHRGHLAASFGNNFMNWSSGQIRHHGLKLCGVDGDTNLLEEFSHISFAYRTDTSI